MVGTLSQKFRELRRPPSTSTTSPSSDIKLIRPLQTVSLLKSVPIPPGEDEASFESNNKLLLSEFKKTKPNISVVQNCMKRTFAFRRNDILSGKKEIDSILIDYPFLTHFDYVRHGNC